MASEDEEHIGNRCYRLKDFGSATEHYTKAIANTLPTNQVYLSNLFSRRALCNKELENWDEVIEDSKTALRLDSKNSRAIYCFAFANFKLARGKELYEYLKVVLACAMEAKEAYELAAKQTACIDQESCAELVSLTYIALRDELEDTFGKFVNGN